MKIELTGDSGNMLVEQRELLAAGAREILLKPTAGFYRGIRAWRCGRAVEFLPFNSVRRRPRNDKQNA